MPEELNLEQTSIAALTDCIRSGEVVPIVGAGLSAPFGYPQWEMFLRRCAAEVTEATSLVNYLLDQKQFERATSVLYEATHDRGMIEKITDSFASPRYQLEELREKIARVQAGDTNMPAVCALPLLFKGFIATTNVDNLLKDIYKVYQSTSPKILVNTDSDTAKYINDRDKAVIFKVHGHPENDNNRIFSRAEYQYHYLRGISSDLIDQTKNLPKTLSKLFLEKTILFLGCSLYPDRFLQVLRATYEQSQRRHFAIVPRSEISRESHKFSYEMSRYGITPIFYPSGHYNDITKILLHINSKSQNHESSLEDFSAAQNRNLNCLHLSKHCKINEIFDLYQFLAELNSDEQSTDAIDFINTYFKSLSESYLNGKKKVFRLTVNKQEYCCQSSPAFIDSETFKREISIPFGKSILLVYQPNGRHGAVYHMSFIAEPDFVTLRLTSLQSDVELKIAIHFS